MITSRGSATRSPVLADTSATPIPQPPGLQTVWLPLSTLLDGSHMHFRLSAARAVIVPRCNAARPMAPCRGLMRYRATSGRHDFWHRMPLGVRRDGRAQALGSALGALEPMHPALTKSSIFLAAVLIGSPAGASVIQCQSEKGAGYPWSWREIDGKRCWYKGTPGMDKKQLSWAATKTSPSAAPRRARSVMIEQTAERERLLHSYWPPLPRTDLFGQLFEAVRGERR